MARTLPRAKKLMIAVIGLGTVALGTAGVAGADSSTATPASAHHYDCTRAPKALARIQATEAQIAAGLPKLHAAQTRAQQKGKAKRADRLEKRIARMETPTFKARLEKRKAKIEAKCPGSSPAARTSAASVTA